jgi:hypothetical protein
MPERNEREYEHASRNESMRAAERDVEVAYDPKVIGAMPRAPETEG